MQAVITKKPQRLIVPHRETFPEYERFQETSLFANLIDNAQSMQFNDIYKNDRLVGFFIYWNMVLRILAKNLRGSYPRWFMGTQMVDDLSRYPIKTKAGLLRHRRIVWVF